MRREQPPARQLGQFFSFPFVNEPKTLAIQSWEIGVWNTDRYSSRDGRWPREFRFRASEMPRGYAFNIFLHLSYIQTSARIKNPWATVKNELKIRRAERHWLESESHVLSLVSISTAVHFPAPRPQTWYLLLTKLNTWKGSREQQCIWQIC